MLAEYINLYSTLLVFSFVDPSPAGNYPEWDEGLAGTEATAGGEGADYEDQGEMDSLFDAWDE